MDRLKRNQYLELDGLYFESDTHEWFNDKTTTQYAQKENLQGIALKNLFAFVVRNKDTGEYDRVLMDSKINQIIYSTKSLEEIGVRIDMIKTDIVFNK